MTVKERAPADVQSHPSDANPNGSITLELRVYLYVRDGRWYADAPKLALMTEGASEDEALQCLLEQVAAYVRTASRHGWMDRLHRPATLRHRLWLQAQLLLAKVRHRPASVTNRPITI